MSTDLRIAVLSVGAILLAAGLVASLPRRGRPRSAAGMGLRVLIVALGAGLLTYGVLSTRRAAPVQPPHPDLIMMAGSAFAGCAAPARPAAPPDGATAALAQMLVSNKQTQAFNAATNAYLACLDKAAADFNRQYGADLTVHGRQEIEAMHDRIHNAAVDTDNAVANQFNQQLRIFKARNGPT
jgi:hypothetical protein